MPYKDPEKRRAANNAYRARNKDRIKTQRPKIWDKYYAKHQEKLKARARERYHADPLTHRQKRKAYYQNNKELEQQRAREYHAANKEQANANSRAYHARHKTSINARMRAYAWEHRTEKPAKDRQWRAENPEKVRARKLRRRAIQYNAPINDLTVEQWREIKTHYKQCCVYCERPMQRLTQDHIIPLSKGGSHTASNVVPACHSCNSRKRTGPPLKPVQPMLLTLAHARKPKKRS